MQDVRKNRTTDSSMLNVVSMAEKTCDGDTVRISGRELHMRKEMAAAEAKYAPALELYITTDLSCTEIARQCNVSASAFRSWMARRHRDLLLIRHGMEVCNGDLRLVKIYPPKGQRPATYHKYKDAIEACDSMNYIEYNVSQIARIFGLNGTQLANQLRAHYPDVIPFRERVRTRLGIADNTHRGVRPWCDELYADAVTMYLTTDKTIEQVADECGVSFRGLDQHLRFYHKDVINIKEQRRKEAKSSKKRGALTGNGQLRMPRNGSDEKYRLAVELADTTNMTLAEIASRTGLNRNTLRYHLSTWHKEILLKRRCISDVTDAENVVLKDTKHYLKATADKYAPAIRRLKESGLPTAEVAREFGFNPETFRNYLHEHEPELAARLGMVQIREGKLVSALSMEKYMEAVQLYETTTEPLKSIARRLGLQYNSVGGFVRRNHPEVIDKHDRLVEEENNRKRIARQAEAEGLARRKEEEERQRIIQALEQTGNNRRQAAKLLGICKSTLYNKLKNIDLPK